MRYYSFLILMTIIISSCAINYREDGIIGKNIKCGILYKKVKLMNIMYGVEREYYLAKKDKITYYLYPNGDKIISIYVVDLNFVTPDGIKIGDTARIVTEKSGRVIETDRLCSYVVLESDWVAFFDKIEKNDDLDTNTVFLLEKFEKKFKRN